MPEQSPSCEIHIVRKRLEREGLRLVRVAFAHTYWMEQATPGQFVMHVIEDNLGQAVGAVVTELDGDGKNELIFTGYEGDVVYLYERKN